VEVRTLHYRGLPALEHNARLLGMVARLLVGRSRWRFQIHQCRRLRSPNTSRDLGWVEADGKKETLC
jgi:hypothetical protein